MPGKKERFKKYWQQNEFINIRIMKEIILSVTILIAVISCQSTKKEKESVETGQLTSETVSTEDDFFSEKVHKEDYRIIPLMKVVSNE